MPTSLTEFLPIDILGASIPDKALSFRRPFGQFENVGADAAHAPTMSFCSPGVFLLLRTFGKLCGVATSLFDELLSSAGPALPKAVVRKLEANLLFLFGQALGVGVAHPDAAAMCRR